MIKKIVDIFKGFVFQTLYELELFNDPDVISVIDQRSKACQDCPLRSGNWCSRKNMMSIQTGRFIINPFGIKEEEYKNVRGCGCYLPSKRWTSSECPINKWEKFNHNN